MRPTVDRVLMTSFLELVGNVVPRLGTDYMAHGTGIIGTMLYVTAGEYDKAAEIRVNEAAAFRALLLEGATLVTDADARARLEAAAGSPAASLRISALDAENARLRGGLIDLQAQLEATGGDAARDLLDRTWEALVTASKARSFELPIG
jgi:hypothetical protein